ncbi:MAG: RNA-binding S4 domain-containing protein [Candidatus Omnitrophota bacterium]
MNDNTSSAIRIDKWLWAVRICKTRKTALDLCKKHKVLINGQPVKPSREVRPGQVVTVKREGLEWLYRVRQCLEKRVSAPLSLEYKEDITSPETREQFKAIKKNLLPRRARGAGRPTKKERRDMEKIRRFKED